MTEDPVGTATESESPGEVERLSRMRRLIASRMMESLHSSAQLTAMQEVDVTEVARLRNSVKSEFKARHGASLTFLPFFARAMVEAAQEYPEFNATIIDGGAKVQYHDAVHLGVAVDTPRGLIVPVVRNAESMSVVDISRAIADLAERVRNSQIGPDDLTGSTITISNIGAAGTLTDTPILNYPEVAILGTGAVVRRPRVVVDGEGTESVEIRSVAALPLTYDHRLVDGADAGRFLSAIRTRIEGADFAADVADYLN